MYHYAGNNPVKYTDPDGRVINGVTAIIGASIGGVLGGLSAYAAGGDKNTIIAATITGAAIGGLAGLTLGASLAASGIGAAALQSGAVSAGISGVSNIASQYIKQVKSGEEFFNLDKRELAGAVVGGFISGSISGGVGKTCIPGTKDYAEKFICGNMVGSILGSESSQILSNINKGNDIFENCDKAFVYSASAGIAGGIISHGPGANFINGVKDGVQQEVLSKGVEKYITDK